MTVWFAPRKKSGYKMIMVRYGNNSATRTAPEVSGPTARRLEVELQSQFNNAMSVLGIDPTKSAGIYIKSLCWITDRVSGRGLPRPVVDTGGQKRLAARLQGKVNISSGGIGVGRVEDIEES